jgi:hypothetical protein
VPGLERDVSSFTVRFGAAASQLGDRSAAVRQTVIRIIRDHLRDGSEPSWHRHDLDFSGAVLAGGDFRATLFAGGTVMLPSPSARREHAALGIDLDNPPTGFVPPEGVPP